MVTLARTRRIGIWVKVTNANTSSQECERTMAGSRFGIWLIWSVCTEVPSSQQEFRVFATALESASSLSGIVLSTFESSLID